MARSTVVLRGRLSQDSSQNRRKKWSTLTPAIPGTQLRSKLGADSTDVLGLAAYRGRSSRWEMPEQAKRASKDSWVRTRYEFRRQRFDKSLNP